MLITPAKNEEQNLLEVSRSVTGQKIKPELWVLVDDGSTDRTPYIIKNLMIRYSWIQSIRLPPRPRDKLSITAMSASRALIMHLSIVEIITSNSNT